jgi:aryl sulfotransferase
VMWHLTDAWARRDQPNVVLVHYEDLSADLDGEMRRLAGRLGISVPPQIWPSLVQAATFGHMRDNAVRLTGPPGILKDAKVFFRRGTSGAGREELSAAELDDYRSRAAQLAPPDLLRWLHRDDHAGP